MNRFAEFNRFTNAPLANYGGALFNLPFNMNTFYKLWGVTTPEAARRIIEKQRAGIAEPKNLEEQAISLVGTDVYEKLIIEGMFEGCEVRLGADYFDDEAGYRRRPRRSSTRAR